MIYQPVSVDDTLYPLTDHLSVEYDPQLVVGECRRIIREATVLRNLFQSGLVHTKESGNRALAHALLEYQAEHGPVPTERIDWANEVLADPRPLTRSTT